MAHESQHTREFFQCLQRVRPHVSWCRKLPGSKLARFLPDTIFFTCGFGAIVEVKKGKAKLTSAQTATMLNAVMVGVPAFLVRINANGRVKVSVYQARYVADSNELDFARIPSGTAPDGMSREEACEVLCGAVESAGLRNAKAFQRYLKAHGTPTKKKED